MTKASSSRVRRLVVALAALAASMAFVAPATAERELFFEETAEAFWAVPHQCADGSTVEATLLVRSTRDFDAPDTEDPDPTARVQFLAVCPGGTSFSWAAPTARRPSRAPRTSRASAPSDPESPGTTSAAPTTVTFDVTWTGVGPFETTVNAPGSKRKQRAATATGQVTFDGVVLVDGPANHPTRPAPFIRVDTEK